MRTEIYFIRHCQPDYENRDDAQRALTEKGLADRRVVTEYLADKDIDLVVSSPFRRAVDTVGQFAAGRGMEILLVDDLRERKLTNAWVDDFEGFSRRQWADFSYQTEGGECLGAVQARCLAAIGALLREHPGAHIAVGFHGTALSTVLHYYDPSFGFDEFWDMSERMPWCAHLSFEGEVCAAIETVDLSALSTYNRGTDQQ